MEEKQYSRIMKLVRRVPRIRPLHMDLHCLPCLPAMVQQNGTFKKHRINCQCNDRLISLDVKNKLKRKANISAVQQSETLSIVIH